VDKLYLEDFSVGQHFELGSRSLDEASILAFAREYDPQSFHIDHEAAKASLYGGLIASGWHTMSIFMRLCVDGLLARTHSMGSPGVDTVRWPAPVRPGDTLSASLNVTDVRPSKSKPELGFVRNTGTMVNQKGETVLAFDAALMVRRRPG